MNFLSFVLVTIIIFVNYSCSIKSSDKVYDPLRGEGKYILTPEIGDAPVMHGPSVFGVRPGSPFLYTIPATGKNEIIFSVKGLPNGLNVDHKSGIISGTIVSLQKKEYSLTLIAENNIGKDEKSFVIKVGDEICLTPPLGWNSWNCWSRDVSQKNVLASAKAMVDKGLKNYGWTYINIDDVWQGRRGGKYNAIQANPLTFPDMKELCDEIHQMGLKVGIYSTPWITSYAGFVGGSSDFEDGRWETSMGNNEHRGSNQRVAKYTFEKQDAKQWAEWGIDYLKYDWNPNDVPSTRRMAKALIESGRDIVYSLSNSAPVKNARIYGEIVNCFRTAGDLKDRWDEKGPHLNIREQWKQHKHWMDVGVYGRPGHFPDPDMLVVGHVAPVGKAKELRPSKLTADEQYSHISMWTLWSAPLLIGAPVEMMDEFTLKLLTNHEVLEIHQDEKALSARPVICSPDYEIHAKELADGSIALGLFNFKNIDSIISINWNMLGLEGGKVVRDVWRNKDIGFYDNRFSANVPPHGVIFVKI